MEEKIENAVEQERLDVLDELDDMLTCERCGVRSKDVSEGLDPFHHEITCIDIEVTWCSDCFHESAMEI